MTNNSPPSFFVENHDLLIPIPNTSMRLPLVWRHVKAIRQLACYSARQYLHTLKSQDHSKLEKYKNWMVTLDQMTESIRNGMSYSSYSTVDP